LTEELSMSVRFIRPTGLVLAAALLAACESGPTAPREVEDIPMAATLDQLAAEAARGGDHERAQSLRDAASALRFGVTPSEIAVKLKNKTVIYQAIVVGVLRTGRDGDEVLGRSLVAWTGSPATAVLRVSAPSDFALFAGPSGAGAPDAARGTWLDLVERQRWVATAGSAEMALASVGGSCPVEHAGIRCLTATWDIRINGVFKLDPPGPGPVLPIHTEADAVNGVLLSRAP
jgi:hypothetical protein